MAVYTQVDAAALAAFLARYDVGTALTFKGIAEGVENSNYFVATTQGRFILTLYEKRVDAAQLPYFLALTTHLADAGLPVPRPIQDRAGVALQTLNGRPACLIQFVEGVSVTTPNDAETREVGVALGRLHAAVASFAGQRPNGLGPAGWARLAADCAGRLDAIEPGLEALVTDQLASITAAWPGHLDTATIHADLFPDNVLMLGGKVTGLIDFYFACTDIRAYDIAVTHAAWAFDADGAAFVAGRAAALIDGYRGVHPLSAAEVAALPVLCRAAALRFLLTRAYDWLNTPPGAMVTRKDPLAFARRLRWYAAATPEAILGR